jgi:hypothetical protein
VHWVSGTKISAKWGFGTNNPELKFLQNSALELILGVFSVKFCQELVWHEK